VRRKRAHIVWQPITAKKRKLRKRTRDYGTSGQSDGNPPVIGVRQVGHDDGVGYTRFDHSSIGAKIVETSLSAEVVSFADGHPIPYDENLLERARTQWQFGDWQSLANLERDNLQHHPDRAKLALLAAAGRLQTQQTNEARQYIRLAQDWGCGKKLMSQILIAGVHNSLGRAAVLSGRTDKALKHFEGAIQIGTPGSATVLLAQARSHFQIEQLGMVVKEGNSTLLPNRVSESKWLRTSQNCNHPRLIIINGMARSGSTVTMNIVTDLLKAVNVPYMKYYIADFADLKKFKDHVNQNSSLCCVLKTHIVSDELRDFAESIPAAYLYTKRNIIEVAASYVRMTGVTESAFYREKPVELDDVVRFVNEQVSEMKRVQCLKNQMVFDSDQLLGLQLLKTICDIANHIGIDVTESDVKMIANKWSRSNSAIYSDSIDSGMRTSLKHERETFFHNGHVMADGTDVKAVLPEGWVNEIKRLFVDYVS